MNKRLLVTGLNGTLAPHLARTLQAHGHEVLHWDRHALDPNTASQEAIHAHLRTLAPEGIFHLAMGSEAWAAAMARDAALHNTVFVFTSTAMVFDASSGGPHHIDAARTARDDYGRYKIRCEDAVLAANPRAVIARIGYQIDAVNRSSNNMVAHLLQQAAQGPIRASQAWIPATSFMQDTAGALHALFNLAAQGTQGQAAGLHHLDSNAADAWTYAHIVQTLAQRLQLRWAVEVTHDYVHDQRLLALPQRADTVHLPSLAQRLENL
jgi:dTDP-4-dehydrorhamnose reductase